MTRHRPAIPAMSRAGARTRRSETCKASARPFRVAVTFRGRERTASGSPVPCGVFWRALRRGITGEGCTRGVVIGIGGGVRCDSRRGQPDHVRARRNVELRFGRHGGNQRSSHFGRQPRIECEHRGRAERLGLGWTLEVVQHGALGISPWRCSMSRLAWSAAGGGPGGTIGARTMLEVIGEGGHGAAWLTERRGPIVQSSRSGSPRPPWTLGP